MKVCFNSYFIVSNCTSEITLDTPRPTCRIGGRCWQRRGGTWRCRCSAGVRQRCRSRSWWAGWTGGRGWRGHRSRAAPCPRTGTWPAQQRRAVAASSVVDPDPCSWIRNFFLDPDANLKLLLRMQRKMKEQRNKNYLFSILGHAVNSGLWVLKRKWQTDGRFFFLIESKFFPNMLN